MLQLPAHDSGLVWVVSPSPWDTFSPYLLPVLIGALNQRIAPFFKWRTHENESAEKYLNLERHQDADGFSGKRY
jgi:hypothetical protein